VHGRLLFDLETAETYGRLKEGSHVAGYSFERACTHLEWLLEGDRWRLGGQFDDVNAFLDSLKLDQFRIVAEQRKRIAQRIKALQPDASQRKIAKLVGVDHTTIGQDLGGGNPPHPTENPNHQAPSDNARGGNPPPRDPGGARAAQLVERASTLRGTQGTGENEWYTPVEWLDRARAVLGGFDLDPASSAQAQRIVKAERYYTADDDGLQHEWTGRVWMNPPYAQPAIDQFAEKLAREIEAGRVIAAIALTHNYTDTRWFHRLASVATAICFPEGRIRFVAPDGSLAAPTQGQALFYFGDDGAAFRSAFADCGLVLWRAS
jgi:ParB family chromosome partitioning protein